MLYYYYLSFLQWPLPLIGRWFSHEGLPRLPLQGGPGQVELSSGLADDFLDLSTADLLLKFADVRHRLDKGGAFVDQL